MAQLQTEHSFQQRRSGLRILLSMPNLRSSGGLTVGQGLLKGFGDLETDDHYFVLHPDGLGYDELVKNTKMTSIPITMLECDFKYKFYIDQFVIPKIIKQQHIDILLTCNSIGSWRPGCPHVALVQLPYLAYSYNELEFRKEIQLAIRYYAWKSYFAMMKRHLNAVIVQTPVMQQRIINRWHFQKEQVHVIPPAVAYTGSRGDIAGDDLPDQLKSKNKLHPYICYVAGPIEHKNFEIFPKTLSYLAKQNINFNLVLTVSPSHVRIAKMLAEARTLGVEDRILCIGSIPHTQVPALLKNAFCMIMPTLLETMGLPYIESMHAGCPIVTSDRDFARWACGNGAVYFDPHDPVSIGKAIIELMDDANRKLILASAEMHLKKVFTLFSWKEVASFYTALFYAVINQNISDK
jgi:glycosyltransferase involved in cell wall biosynthesis